MNVYLHLNKKLPEQRHFKAGQSLGCVEDVI